MGSKITVKRRVENAANLDKIYGEFIRHKQALNLSADTISNYNRTYNMFASWYGRGDTAGINVPLIDDFIIALNDGTRHIASVNHYIRDLRTFLYWCMDSGYISPPFKVAVLRGQETEKPTLTDDEVAALLVKPARRCAFAEYRSWVVVNWLLATGNRASTICAVQLGDLDFNRREITLTHTKNKQAQIIPMSAALESVLRTYIRTWRYGEEADAPLFCAVDGAPLTRGSLRLSINRYMKGRGVDKTGVHIFRHTYARLWITEGDGNLFKLQKMLGHSTLKMTQHYAHIYAQDLHDGFEAANPLDCLLRDNAKSNVIRRK